MIETRQAARVSARAVGPGVHVSGYASVTGQAYGVQDFLGEYTETIAPGAFAAALAAGPDVRLLVNHDGVPLARTTSGTLTLQEVTNPASDPLGRGLTGLYVEADLDGLSPLAQSARSALGRGDMSQMSFAFRVGSDAWNSDYTRRDIRAIAELLDVSLVTFPANAATVAAVS